MRSSAHMSPPRVRYAVVGLGHIAQAAILPAFAHAENAELTALVSDDRDKLNELGRLYGAKHLSSYDAYDELLASGVADAVYIALPNHLHCEYAVRAARAGVHVLCEKPMAVTEAECWAMNDAARETGVKLMVAYRLHFERANMEAVELVKGGRLGDVRLFNSTFAVPVQAGDIRLRRETGGGTLWDIGIYCVNAARYLFRAEPEEVFAFRTRGHDPKFEVDETTTAVLRFPGERLAAFTTSFGTESVSSYRVAGTKGTLHMSPAYEYDLGLGFTSEIEGREEECRFEPHDQFAPVLMHFAGCIQRDVDPEPGGLEGLADVRIVEALYRAAELNKPVKVEPLPAMSRPDARLAVERPPVQDAPLVKTSSPHG